MSAGDDRLGMHREITRRDFLNGTRIAIGAALLPGCSDADLHESDPIYYPPALTGLRGSHPGSFEAAHAIVQGQRWEASEPAEHYDLVVVGAGISGLAAAYIHRRDVNPDARILILDNHDDFGGHAKRNEFTIDGRTLIGFGGTMLMESPGNYPDAARQVIRELGISADSHEPYYDRDLFRSLGMQRGTFFDRETFGADHLSAGQLWSDEALADAPLSAEGKAEFARLGADEINYLEDKSLGERLEILQTHSFAEYLQKFAGFGDEALLYMQKVSHGVWAIGADALPAWMAWIEGYPGFGGMELDIPGYDEAAEDYEYKALHFPDGNASVARLLVRSLVPGVAPGSTMEDIVIAPFDYSRLDTESSNVRIRLSSMVVQLSHVDGNPDGKVDVIAVHEGKSTTVRADKVVWAGYHAMLPYICADVPAEQADSLSSTIRAPLVYTTVLIRNWQSFVKLGIHRAYCPGSFFQSVRIDSPISIGGYRHSSSPDDPVLLHLQHIPLDPGAAALEQFRSGRQRLLETSFEEFERNVREQLGRLLGPGGFDPARDIAGITVNRWPHGYAYSVDKQSGDVAWWPQVWQHDRKPWVEARRRIGNISLAGTDSASDAMTEVAIVQAHRAVHELERTE